MVGGNGSGHRDGHEASALHLVADLGNDSRRKRPRSSPTRCASLRTRADYMGRQRPRCGRYFRIPLRYTPGDVSMADPFPPPQQVGAEGQPFPARPRTPSRYPDDRFGPAAAPRQASPIPAPIRELPPPVGYPQPKPRRRKVLWLSLLALGAGGRPGGGRAGRPRPPGPPRAPACSPRPRPSRRSRTISSALSNGDTETIARNNLCGMYDAVKDRRGDHALARLASDAFRRQFTRAEVTSIDKIVLSSSYQAQVLFTMRVAPASGARSSRGRGAGCRAGAAPGQPAAGVLVPTANGRPVLIGRPLRRLSVQLNESPQAQEPVAFGLSIVKPCFSMVSTKSIVAPCT